MQNLLTLEALVAVLLAMAAFFVPSAAREASTKTLAYIAIGASILVLIVDRSIWAWTGRGIIDQVTCLVASESRGCRLTSREDQPAVEVGPQQPGPQPQTAAAAPATPPPVVNASDTARPAQSGPAVAAAEPSQPQLPVPAANLNAMQVLPGTWESTGGNTGGRPVPTCGGPPTLDIRGTVLVWLRDDGGVQSRDLITRSMGATLTLNRPEQQLVMTDRDHFTLVDRSGDHLFVSHFRRC